MDFAIVGKSLLGNNFEILSRRQIDFIDMAMLPLLSLASKVCQKEQAMLMLASINMVVPSLLVSWLKLY